MAEPALKLDTKSLSRFETARQFSHRPPYDTLIVERVPLLQIFQLACTNYMQQRKKQSLWKQFFPGGYPFYAAECGVYTGSSLLACAALARDTGLFYRMIGLDTFSGLPPLSDKDRSLAPEAAPYLTSQFFTGTSLEMVQKKIAKAKQDRNIQLRQGLFSITLPALPERRYHFVNIDCDLYDPHLECLEYFYPRMVEGGIVFFDDYHSVEYPMAGRAIDDFMADKPERLMHLRFGDDGPNLTKSFFVKY